MAAFNPNPPSHSKSGLAVLTNTADKQQTNTADKQQIMEE
jgi:hypothetical protein